MLGRNFSWMVLLLIIEKPLELNGLGYIGCYNDNKVRDVSGSITHTNENSFETCRKICQGFTYFGMSYTVDCYCGNSYGKYGKADESSCNRKCPGNKAQMCGGDMSISVYKTELGPPKPPSSNGCSLETNLDITFVVDGSGSIGASTFNTDVKQILKNLIDYIQPGDKQTTLKSRIACVLYSDEATISWKFTDYSTKEKLFQAIDALKYPEGSTSTGDALYLVRTDLHPQVRAGITHLVFVITDGNANTGTRNFADESKALKKLGAQIFAIGVGKEISDENLDLMSSGPGFKAHATSYKDLLQKIPQIAQDSCNLPTVKPKPDPDVCIKDITFLIDASASIEAHIFQRDIKGTMKRMIDAIIPGSESEKALSRVATVVFSNNPKVEWTFDQYTTKKMMHEAINRIGYMGEETATGDALNVVLTQIHPTVRANIKHAVILITDGNENYGNLKAVKVAEKLKAAGAEIFVIGVGDTIDGKALNDIASSKEHRMDVSDYKKLLDQAGKLASVACQDLGKPLVTYRVEIRTPDEEYARASCEIHMKFIYESQESDYIHLKTNSSNKPFTQNSLNDFSFELEDNGEIKSIHFKCLKCEEFNVQWLFDYIKVSYSTLRHGKSVPLNYCVKNPYNQWFCINEGENQTPSQQGRQC